MWFHSQSLKNLSLSSLLIFVAGLVSCTNRPTNHQLELWRQEAIARNAEIVADNAKKNPQSAWDLLVQGQTTTGKSLKLDWSEILSLANTHIQTTDPNSPLQLNQVLDFQGVPVSSLLKELGYQSNVTEISFLCYDSYLVTVKLADLLKYPILLAIAKQGKPISRGEGGLIYLVFPYTTHPEIKSKYNESSWGFYVSNIVIGTEPAQLQVGTRTLNLIDLDQLPQTTLSETVGYRIGWPNGKVKLHGVRIRDILNFAGVDLASLSEVIVRGKAPIHHNSTNPVSLSGANVRDCKIILATRWGDDKQLIPAKLGRADSCF